MLMRMLYSWLIDEKRVREQLTRCRSNLQSSKKHRRDCLKSAENCSKLVDSYLMIGYSCDALECLEMYKNSSYYASEAKKTNNMYIGIILQYESWLDKC